MTDLRMVMRVKNHSTDPLKTDTDGDGSDDGYEVNRFFDPLDASINPSTLLADSYDEFQEFKARTIGNTVIEILP